jgi:hypothetical protein
LDVAPIPPVVLDPAAAAGLVRSLQQGRQNAAATGFGFAAQRVQGAVAATNLVTLFGGDVRPILAAAENALGFAASDVRTLRDGIVASGQSGSAPAGAALGQLGALGGAVQDLALAVKRIVNAPPVYRAERARVPARRSVAAMRDSLKTMSGDLAAGQLALSSPTLPLVNLTI